MAGEKNVNGNVEILFLYCAIKDAEGAEVAANYFPLGCLTTNGITKNNETKEGTITKCNKSPEPSYVRSSYTITADATAIENDGLRASYNAISDAMDKSIDENKPVFWKIETTLEDGSKETKFGKGLLTELSRTAPADGEVTWSINLLGIGKISNTDLHV